MNAQIETRTEFVIRHLREAMPKRWPEISQASGVPEKTIYKIAYRETKDPRSSTVDALHSYFEKQAIETGELNRRINDNQHS